MSEAPSAATAIVGMAGRFPGADDVSDLWAMLREGRGAVRRLDAGELRGAGVPESVWSDPAYLPFGTTVSGVDAFDAEFFGMSPGEADATDPQHRLFMECALRALEDAGVPSGARVGVFASIGFPDYLVQNVVASGRFDGADLPYSVRIGNQVDFLAGRLCHALDLRGPAVGVQTSCSSSLVGVDAARTALLMDRCDVAVVGASALKLPHPSGYLYAEGGFGSRDGQCRPFDARATGFVAGNGAAVVVLKRIGDAVADRDRIYATVLGVGVTNDGADKISYTAPSTSGQVAAITQAIDEAGVDSAAVGYVEAHGSATPLGDPIEVDALAKAYAGAGGVAAGCGLGSIKANIGHMSSACGIAGLVKSALVLHHQFVPPQINYAEPNPLIDLERSGFTIRDQAYQPDDGLRAAAVSSLGVGGTNVHVVLGAAAGTAAAPRPEPREGPYDLLLAARTEDDLRTYADDLHRHLTEYDVRLDDVAHTLARGRPVSRVTASVRAHTTDEARDELRRIADGADLVPAPSGASGADLPGALPIPLPKHPLRRVRHWIEPASALERPAANAVEPDLDGGLVDQVVGIFRSHLGVEDIGPDDHLDSVGGTSLKAVEIVDAITDRIGPTISLTTFIRLGTPRRVTEEIRAWPGGNLVDPVLMRLNDAREGTPTFLIHPANGTSFCYQRFAQRVPFAGPTYAVSYPFADADPPETIPDMAARYVAELRSVAPDGPCRLGGYSLGGNIAMEMAHQIRAAGEEVADVVMIDALPPESYPGIVDEEQWLRIAPVALSYFLGLPAPDASAGTVDEVVALLRQPTWSVRTEETMRRFVRMFVRTGRALAAVPRRSPMGVDVTVLAATERSNPVFDALGIQDLPPHAWQRYTTGDVTAVPLPGNHYTLYSDPANFERLVVELERLYAAPPT